MRKITMFTCLLLLALAGGYRVFAQEAPKAPEQARAPEPAAHYYHLEFLIQELGTDGKPTNGRNYSTIVSTDRGDKYSAIRTGSRIPIITGAFQGSTGGSPAESKPNFQYQYIDVGVNIDTQNVHEIGHQLAIYLKAEISSLAESSHTLGSELPNDPVIRQNTWQASVVIPVGKPTVVFSSEALDNKGGMQLVVTATPLQ
jgi:hypothetical protein